MKIEYKKMILLSLFFYPVYISLTIGMSWDEIIHQNNGRNLIRYILSFGNLEYKSLGLPFHFGFYDAFSHFITLTVPAKFNIFIHHLINLTFSISTIFGITQLTKILFNKKISMIVFILVFFNPIYFGHMSINPKDTIIAFSLIWMCVLVLKYLKSQHIDYKRTRYTYLIATTLFIGLGVRLTFIGTLLPIIFIIFYEIIFNKKNNSINVKLFLFDFIKVFLISYLVTIIFWPEMHKNILTPHVIIADYFDQLQQGNYGLYWGLLNGRLINLSNTPFNYLFVNFFYKMPEFFIISLFFLPFILLFDLKFFEKNFINFKKNFYYLLLFILIPIIIFILLSIKVTVGIKFFLFLIPFLSILPALVFYYLIEKKNIISKIFLVFLSILFIFYLTIFIKISPYQYTYINAFNGKFSNNITKFENDYWGLSLKHLIKTFDKEYDFKEGKKYKIAFCGVGLDSARYYLDKIVKLNYVEVHNHKKYDFIIMTNLINGDKYSLPANVQSCFKEFKGSNLFSVERMNLKLSVIRSRSY